jgi:isopentenyl-diphosphate delta-isomerase
MSPQKDRKKDHIELTTKSRIGSVERDRRFYYEPLLSCFPNESAEITTYFAGRKLNAPIWVSSMTGGTALARQINRNLARVCNDFGLGMGLGSCRKLLHSDDELEDFAVRGLIGEQPLYANLGIAQVIEIINNRQHGLIKELLNKTEADGLIVHVNPNQEWLQPEGDEIREMSPIKAISDLLDKMDIKIIVKEVGQGMGPKSLQALLQMPLAGLEFGAFGGTNFAKLELLRGDNQDEDLDPICFVGHTADEMIEFIHDLDRTTLQCKDFIISGGIKNYLDGYYYNQKLQYNSIYGQASSFLKYAKNEYEDLYRFAEQQINGYKYALRYLRIKR